MSLTTSAQFRSDAEMRNAAGRILGSVTRSSFSPTMLLKSDEMLAVYGNDRGFVVTARDKRQRAVIGYSFTKYDEDNMPCGLKWWLKASNEAMKSNMKSNTSVTRASQRHASYSAVEPFLTSTWNQDTPYNYDCPKVESTGKNCMTGCVATAMAQAMYYYQYPASAKFTGTYYVDSEEKTKSISSTYDWAGMKDSYTGKEKKLEAKPVSTLMRDCGYSVGMSYSANSSGAYDLNIGLALHEVFQYDSLAVKYYDRRFYTDEEWYNIVYSALEERQPVLYAGMTEEMEGHEFLLCGINSDGLVWVNWGWGGDGDGYFDMDAPRYYSRPFTLGQTVVVGMRPQVTPDSKDHYESMWLTDSINYTAANDPDSLWLQMSYLYNYSLLEFNGTIDVTLVDKNNPTIVRYLNLLDTNKEFEVKGEEDEEEKAEDGEGNEDAGETTVIGPIGAFYGFSMEDDDTVCVGGLRDVPEGIYSMYLTSNEVRDSERQLVRVPGGRQVATLKKLSDGRILVSNEDVPDIEDTAVRQTRNVQKGEEAVYDLSGRRMNKPARRGIYIVGKQKEIR